MIYDLPVLRGRPSRVPALPNVATAEGGRFTIYAVSGPAGGEDGRVGPVGDETARSALHALRYPSRILYE